MASLLAGALLPLILRGSGLDKKIMAGIGSAKKSIGLKKGGYVNKTEKKLVHKGEFVVSKADVAKLKKEAKKVGTKKGMVRKTARRAYKK